MAPAPFTPAAGETNPKAAINVAAGVTMVSQSDAEKVPATVLPKAVSVTVAGAPVVDAKTDAPVPHEIIDPDIFTAALTDEDYRTTAGTEDQRDI